MQEESRYNGPFEYSLYKSNLDKIWNLFWLSLSVNADDDFYFRGLLGTYFSEVWGKSLKSLFFSSLKIVHCYSHFIAKATYKSVFHICSYRRRLPFTPPTNWFPSLLMPFTGTEIIDNKYPFFFLVVFGKCWWISVEKIGAGMQIPTYLCGVWTSVTHAFG